MKQYKILAGLAVLMGILHSSAYADLLFLHNTGEGLTQGQADPNWIVALGNGLAAQAVSATDPNNGWVAPAAGSSWISTAQSNGRGSIDPGLYTYSTTFTIGPGYNLATAQISGKWWSDEPSAQNGIYLNGVLVSTFGGAVWSDPNPGDASFSLTSGFVAGLNTLSFRVLNTAGPGGALIEDLSGSIGPVPEPSTYIAGALLLLPFSVQGIRCLRNRKASA